MTNANGALLSQQRYMPFGQLRTDDFAPGSIGQTDFAYTGQRNVDGLGLMDYKARFYDAALGRFVQPDTIVPNAADPQSWNRYSYVLNEPVGMTDPTGNFGKCGDKSGYGCRVTQNKVKSLEGRWDAEAKAEAAAEAAGHADFCTRNPIACSSSPMYSAAEGNQPGLSAIGLVSSNSSGWYSKLEQMGDLINWSLTTPGEMTLYESPGYPLLGGIRAYYQPFLVHDNGSPITLGPTSIGAGSVTLKFTGEFVYKLGLNSISALGIPAPGFQPYALKINLDTSVRSGSASFTNRMGFEFTARPDKLAVVVAAAAGTLWYFGRISTGTVGQGCRLPNGTPC